MKLEELLKMDLQFFAKNPEGGNEPDPKDEDPGNENLGEENPEGKGEVELPTTQSELDALVNKSNQAAIKNATKNMVPKEDLDDIIDEKLSEAEKLRNMTDEEKEEHEVSKLQKKIEEYERKENLNEMSKEATNMLEEKGFSDFDDFIPYIVTEEAESTKERVESFSKALEAYSERIKENLQKQLGTRTILDGNSAANSSLGAQLAERHNEQHKEPDNDPWKIN